LGLVVAYLFVSMARGQATHLSDVDIGVLFVPGMDTETSVERQLELMVALDDLADREIQVTVLNRAPPAAGLSRDPGRYTPVRKGLGRAGRL
jgi:predicted nucleotidyltransferase